MMWSMIKKLSDGKYGEKKRTALFNEGEVVDVEMKGDIMLNFWREVYQSRENRIKVEWNENLKDAYVRQWEEGINLVEQRGEGVLAGHVLVHGMELARQPCSDPCTNSPASWRVFKSI